MFLLRFVFSIGSQSIDPLISMDKNFVRVDILIPVYESSLDRKLWLVSDHICWLLMICSFHISIAYPIIRGAEILSHVRAARMIGGSL